MRIAGVTWSSTVASISAPLACAAGEQPRALGDGVARPAPTTRSTASRPTSEPSDDLPLRGSPAASVAALAASLATKASATVSSTISALGRHADLALVHEGAEGGGVDRLVEVGVVEHDQRRLAAELEQHRLQMARRESRRRCRPTRVEPVKLTRRTAGWAISASTIARGIGRRVGDDVDDALAAGRPRGRPRRSGDACADRSPRP